MVEFNAEQQAEVNRIVQERLERDRQSRSTNNQTDPAILTLLNEVKTELATERNKRLELEKTQNQSTIETLKKKIVADMKITLPDSLLQYVTGTDEASLKASIEKIAKDLGPGPSIGGATNPPGGNAAPRQYTREMLSGMSPKEINADWDNISKQMATWSPAAGKMSTGDK